jgi:ribosomal protein S12 methylthiotransferase
MKRGVTRAGHDRILDRLEQSVPGLAIRTTFIVGFPGETDEDFQQLVDFVRQRKFHHVGVFTYFQEEGTPAATLGEQVPDHVKQARRDELMRVQAEISEGRLQALVGTSVPVLVEGVSDESEFLLKGRTPWQAPDVDGQVFISSAPETVKVGDIHRCKIIQAGQYDLVAEIEDLTV